MTRIPFFSNLKIVGNLNAEYEKFLKRAYIELANDIDGADIWEDSSDILVSSRAGGCAKAVSPAFGRKIHVDRHVSVLNSSISKCGATIPLAKLGM